ncbi:hypothetical protein BGZ46_010326 [Entomortierella lignicola]|nr:hypothetical protein BGZ46_010326 [Entomortierella lignicola]
MSNMLFNPEFWKTFVTPDRYSYEQIPDLTGKVAIVTGASSGIGYHTTLGLAAKGCHVVMACRSKSRCDEAIASIREDIKSKYPNTSNEVKLEFLQLDLNSLTQVQDSAQEFLKRDLPLHILINNGGITGEDWVLSADGIEQQFAFMETFLPTTGSHFMFTLALLNKLKASQPSRIVIVSSMVYEHSASANIDFEHIATETESQAIADICYSRSKFANILFAKALARRLSNEAVYCNALHPGIVYSNMTVYKKLEENTSFTKRLHHKFLTSLLYALGVPPERGALTHLYCATSPEIETENIRGKYFIPIGNQIQAYHTTDDEKKQEDLWRISEEIIEKKLNEAKARSDQ